VCSHEYQKTLGFRSEFLLKVKPALPISESDLPKQFKNLSDVKQFLKSERIEILNKSNFTILIPLFLLKFNEAF